MENPTMYVIAQPCIDVKDKACVDVCPVEAFHEAPDCLYINPDSCIDCDASVPECQVDFIEEEFHKICIKAMKNFTKNKEKIKV